jgi:probable F420-dependent oxidoreductase
MAAAAERVAFDSVWISDHLGFGDPAGSWRGAWECWTLLSAVAARTERVALGTYVLAVPFRNPALLAKMAETLDEVSGGRLILGVGAGWNEPEFEAFDFPFEGRFDRFEEALRLITTLLREGRASIDGQHVRARDARLEPRGPRPRGLPVMVGTSGRRLIRLTAELADHWNGGLRTPEALAPLLEQVDDACRSLGRDPGTLARSAEVRVRPVAPDESTAPPEDQELRGTPDELAAALRRYADIGIRHLQVQLRPNTVASVEAFAPILTALHAAG